MIRKMLRDAQILMLAVIISFFCMPLHAQLSNGTIRGTVTDSTGAIMPNATIELVKEGTGEHFSSKSNKDGYYTFAALSPGEYVVKVSHEGFTSFEGRLTLRVAQEAVIDASLKTGSVSTTVAVSDVTPMVDAGDGTLSDVKDAARIDTLPLENSNFLNVLNFSPGVVAGSYGGQGSGYTRVNGIPGGSITFQVDGQSANDRFTNDLQATPQALQTIQELKVTTSNGSAEYGTPGVVDVVTKGGGNQFHGQVHEIYQTGGFEAKGYNANPSHLVHNDFGGQFDGPVLFPKLYNGRNKTFFFFDVNKQIQHKLGADGELVPQSNWLTGDFSDYVDVNGNPVTIYDPLSGVYDPTTGYVTRQPFPNNQIPTSRFNPIAVKILSYLPAPNLACPSQSCYETGSPNWLSPSGTATDNIMRYTGKLDQLIGKELLSGRYTYTSEPQLGPAFGGYSGTLLNPQLRAYGGHNGVLSLTSPIGSHAVNEARVGVQLFNAYSGPVPQPGLMASLGLPVYPGTVAWDGFYWYDNNQYYMASIDRPNPKSQPNQSVTLGDNFSLSVGKHEMKFGIQGTNSRVNTTEGQNPGGNNGFSGNYTGLQAKGTIVNQTSGANAVSYTPDTGAGLADMLLGETDFSFYEAVPVFHTRQSDIDFFAEDNWKLSSKLTVNLGVRYEYWTPYTDAGGLSATLDLKNASSDCTVPSSLTGGAPQPCVTPGTTGYPSWFGQTQPSVIIPNSGKDQDAASIAAYKAIGLPIERASAAGVASSLWNMPKNNWAPRVGFAYQFNEKTIARGGYGIYFWTMPLVQYQQNTRDNDPWFVSATNQTDNNNNLGAELAFPFGPSGLANQCNCTSLPGGYADPRQLGVVTVNPSAGAAINTGFTLAAWDPNYKAQQAQEWNLTVERALPGNWAASLGYVGNHGSHLVEYDPINADLPRELITGAAYSAPAARRPYPIYGDAGTGSMDEFRFIGYSNHNELRAEIRHTFKGSFILQSYFTFAKSMTTSEGSLNSFGGLEMQPATLTNNEALPQRLRAIYAPDSYVAAKTFVVNGHYELPLGRHKQFLNHTNTLVNEAVSGWNTSFFYMWHSGLFFGPHYLANPGIGNSANEYILAPGAMNRGILPRNKRTKAEWFNASVWDPASGMAYAGQTYEVRDNQLDWDMLNAIPRNYMTGPGFSNADGTLYKLTPIGEHTTFDLEMQVFNVFNHTNLGLPGNGGAISTGIGTPRLLQFQGKLTF